jgi:OH-DDVA oxygenase/3-O-methylgallate 3,4-dioxygenase
MAEIVLGMWTTHGPTLSSDADQWLLRVPADREHPAHPFKGGAYSFDELVELRRGENLAAQSALQERARRSDACSAALDRMADVFADLQPDVAVILGNDQRELFLDPITPAITVFCGESWWDQPSTAEQARQMPPGIHEAERGHKPPQRTEYPGLPDLAERIVREAMASGFDPAVSKILPVNPGHWATGIGHAFGFVYRQIMRDRVIPNVPIILNTFFPPNQPTARRCFEFGQVVGRALRDWSPGTRVAVFGSGGMSHFVIDEDLDHAVLAAIMNRNEKGLVELDEALLQSGTSELKNWIAAAGVLFDTPLQGEIVDYVPCYRSEAGTGTANSFIYWS